MMRDTYRYQSHQDHGRSCGCGYARSHGAECVTGTASKTTTEKLQLSIGEKSGAGHPRVKLANEGLIAWDMNTTMITTLPYLTVNSSAILVRTSHVSLRNGAAGNPAES
jgi:hypothetical protein